MSWEKVKISDVCQIDNGFAFKSNNYVSNEGARVIRITNVQKGKIVDNDPKFYPYDLLLNLDRYEIFEGDIMMSLTGNVGRVGKFPKEMLPAYINQRICRVKPLNDRIDKNYLFQLLNSNEFEKDAIYASAGAAQLNLSTNWVANYEIPLPPLSEQKKIAEKLDKADSMRKKDQELLKYYDELAQSVFIDMFGDPVKNEKGWEVNLFGDKFQISSGGTPRTNIPEYWENGTISWIGSNMCQDKVLYENDGRFITELGLQNSSAKIFGINTVLVALVGATIGKTALLKFPTSTNQNIAGIQIKDYEPMFIFYLIQNLYNKFMELGNGGFKMANLTFIRNLPLISPSLFLQQNFANIIENIEEQKKKVKQQAQESENLFQALLQESFS